MNCKQFAILLFLIPTISTATNLDYFGDPSTRPLQETINDVDTGMGVEESLVLKTPERIQVDSTSKRSLTEISPFVLNANKITAEKLHKVFGCNSTCNLEDFYILANFIHGKTADGRSMYWIAIFPRESRQFEFKMDRLIAQHQWFEDGGGAHGQTRFEFTYINRETIDLRRRILLIPQNGLAHFNRDDSWDDFIIDATTTDSEATSMEAYARGRPIWIPSSLIYSLYVLKPLGVDSFDSLDGLVGMYTTSMSLFSTQDRATDQTNRAFVEQFEFEIETQQDNNNVRAALEESIKTSLASVTKNPMGEYDYKSIYNTVFKNCVSETMRILAIATGRTGSIDPTLFNPFIVKRHLVEENGFSEIDTFNTEFGGSVTKKRPNDPEQQETFDKIDENMPLLQTVAFDRFLRRIAFYSAVNEWTKQELQQVIAAVVPNKDAEQSEPQDISHIQGAEQLKKDLAQISQEQQAELLPLALANPDWALMLAKFRSAEQ